jgi:hypothetical protein
VSINRDNQPTNDQLFTPKREHWQVQVRHYFKLTVSVQNRNMTEAKIIKFQKDVENLAVRAFQGGSIEYKIE